MAKQGGKCLRALVALIVVVGLFPVVPASLGVDEAEATVGTTDYDSYFNRHDQNGTPTRTPTNGTLRVAGTQSTSDYVNVSGSYQRRSDGMFVSKKKCRFFMIGNLSSQGAFLTLFVQQQ